MSKYNRKVRRDKGVKRGSFTPEFLPPEPLQGETEDQYYQRLAKLRVVSRKKALAERHERALARKVKRYPPREVEINDVLTLLNYVADKGRDRGWTQGEGDVKVTGSALRQCLDWPHLERRYVGDRRLYLTNGGIQALRESGRLDVDYWAAHA